MVKISTSSISYDKSNLTYTYSLFLSHTTHRIIDIIPAPSRYKYKYKKKKEKKKGNSHGNYLGIPRICSWGENNHVLKMRFK